MGFQPYKYYNKFGLSFDMDNTLAFSNADEKALSKNVIKEGALNIRVPRHHNNVYFTSGNTAL